MLASLLLAGLVADTLRIAMGSYERIERRKAFLAWLEDTVLAPRSGPGMARFLDNVAAQLKALLSGYVDEGDVTVEQASLATRLRQFYVSILPHEIASRLLADPTFASAAAMATVAPVNVGGTDFRSDLFWAACARALRRGRARTRATDRNWVELKAADGAIIVSGALDARIIESFFPALAATGEERAREIAAFLERLDLPPDEHAMFERRAAKSRRDDAMVEILREAEEASVITGYGTIASALRDRAPPSAEFLLPPRSKRLLHHLRLGRSDAPFPARVANAWLELKLASVPASRSGAWPVCRSGSPTNKAGGFDRSRDGPFSLGPAKLTHDAPPHRQGRAALGGDRHGRARGGEPGRWHRPGRGAVRSPPQLVGEGVPGRRGVARSGDGRSACTHLDARRSIDGVIGRSRRQHRAGDQFLRKTRATQKRRAAAAADRRP